MEIVMQLKISLIFQNFHNVPVEAYFSGDIPPLKMWRHSYMEIVEVYFQLGHTSTLKSGGILYGNCNVALKFH